MDSGSKVRRAHDRRLSGEVYALMSGDYARKRL